MTDPIVDEVRRVRDAHAARFNYDLDAIFQDIKEREKRAASCSFKGWLVSPCRTTRCSRPGPPCLFLVILSLCRRPRRLSFSVRQSRKR